MRTEKEIGEIIKQLRGKLSLREFAKLCDVSHTTIDNLEKGIDFRTKKPTQVTLNTLYKIAKATNVSVSYIIGENITKLCVSKHHTLFCTEHEKELLLAYRAKPEYQLAVDIILEIDENSKMNVYKAAHSESKHSDTIEPMEPQRWNEMESTPGTDENLIDEKKENKNEK